MGPIGWPELVALVFWAAIIAGVVWLVRRVRGISEDVAAIRRKLEEPGTQSPPVTPPNEPPRG
jgi:hypothetical protein